MIHIAFSSDPDQGGGGGFYVIHDLYGLNFLFFLFKLGLDCLLWLLRPHGGRFRGLLKNFDTDRKRGTKDRPLRTFSKTEDIRVDAGH